MICEKCIEEYIYSKLPMPIFDMPINEKPRYDLVPWDAMEEAVKVITTGQKKHPNDEWKSLSAGTHLACAFRHLVARARGEIIDDDGLPHTAHAICRLLFICSLDKTGGNNELG
jgi:hypothetical protein